MKNDFIVSVIVSVIVVTLAFVFFARDRARVLGNASSPSVIQGVLDIEGVQTLYRSSAINQASTTICSLKSPSATSTLAFGSVKLTTGTTTAIALELAKSTVMDATTTRISYAVLASGAQSTLIAAVASTTGLSASAVQHTSDENDLIFAPNTYLNAKYGNTLGTTNVLKGSCKAKFIVN